MKHALVVTLVGPDRPGIVGRLADVVAAHDADWLESRMADLAGQFAGIVHVDVPRERAGELAAALHALADRDALTLAVTDGRNDAPARVGRPLVLALTGLDQPGIVRDIGTALAARGVGIEALETERVDGSMSGERLFRARATLVVPPDVSDEALDEALQAVSAGLMVDVELADEAS